jgi:hypothetical protein
MSTPPQLPLFSGLAIHQEEDFDLLVRYLGDLADYLASLRTSDITPNSGWSVSGVSTDKSFNVGTVTLTELANVVGTLITTMISQGLLTA